MSKHKQPKFDSIIKKTHDYGIFKVLKGNRNVNQLHLRRLKQSMMEHPLFTIIFVNQRMEIIDGQHRYFISKELGLPIYYVVIYGYGMEEVKILNSNSEKWKKRDYLESHIDSGSTDYIKFKEFQMLFPDFNFSTCVRLLSGLSSHRSKSFDGLRGSVKDFENGDFKIKDWNKSLKVASKILDFKPYYDKFKDNTFCLTLLSLFEHKNYNHADMLKKLKIQPTAIKPCKTQEQYTIMLESIYNFKRKDKVNLRY
jgi:hypothetical protein